ncbi:alpha/beta fold hydrolase [Geomicrobium sp. JSM 1781026]|uniref:alpha/beta fold hydrolase n=1 Tax=Geomicrobium sp. JSM 1781026 TaxID=3344580 RepID=UPI0035BFE163
MFTQKEYVEIDGHEHGMIIEGTDKENPILLFVHGGPGFPEYPLMAAEKLAWLEDVTVCYWDQPGAGMSYNPKTQGELSIDRYVKDCLAITKHVKQQWKREKIYLFGHSWGSMIACLTAYAHPEHFHALITSGQMGRHRESTKDTLKFLERSAAVRGEHGVVKRVKKVKVDDTLHENADYRMLLGKVNKYGGGMKKSGYSNTNSLVDIMKCRAYTLRERMNILPGAALTYKQVGKEMMDVDVAERTKRFEMPVYIMHGRYDYQTSLLEAERFFEKIDAPHKDFHVFENSAHTPFIEEQDKFIQLFQQILQNDGVTS